MLLTMKAEIAAMRGLAYSAALQIDLAEGGDARAAARASLLTPIVKGWCTEVGQEVASLALQVHGGAGYIEETGAAQRSATSASQRSTKVRPRFRPTISCGARSSPTTARRFLRC